MVKIHLDSVKFLLLTGQSVLYAPLIIIQHLRALFRLLTIGCNCLIVYGLYDYVKGAEMPKGLNAVYSGLNRTVWAVNLAYIIFECVTGNGGIINAFLSFRGWLPFSRLTYCAYLIHPYVMRVIYEGRDRPVHFDNHYTMVYFFCGHLAIAYAVAFVLSVIFEAPFMALEKLLFETLRSNVPPTQPIQKISPQRESSNDQNQQGARPASTSSRSDTAYSSEGSRLNDSSGEHDNIRF